MEINDKTMQALQAAMKFRQLKQEVHAANIANAETPNYKAQKLDFEEALARALDTDGQMNMATSDSKHFNVGNGGFNNLEPEIYDDPNGVVNPNGNTVDRDKELAEMAENKLLYDASVQLINKKFGLLKYTVGSGN